MFKTLSGTMVVGATGLLLAVGCTELPFGHSDGGAPQADSESGTDGAKSRMDAREIDDQREAGAEVRRDGTCAGEGCDAGGLAPADLMAPDLHAGRDLRSAEVDAGIPDGSGGPSDAPPSATVEVTARDVLALTASCDTASTGKFAENEGDPRTVDICRLDGAFFWKADVSIDCDGQPTPECSRDTDPWFQPQTSFKQSDGKYLVAAALPYIVIPVPDSRFDYQRSGIRPGALAVVVRGDTLVYGVFGDENGEGIIGEASYALAKALGCDPDPKEGGCPDRVTYLVFSGTSAVVDPIESPEAARELGARLLGQLVAANR